VKSTAKLIRCAAHRASLLPLSQANAYGQAAWLASALKLHLILLPPLQLHSPTSLHFGISNHRGAFAYKYFSFGFSPTNSSSSHSTTPSFVNFCRHIRTALHRTYSHQLLHTPIANSHLCKDVRHHLRPPGCSFHLRHRCPSGAVTRQGPSRHDDGDSF